MIKGYRKIAMGLVVIAIGVLVESLTKAGLSTNLLALLLGVYGSFTVGNGVEHVTNRGAEVAPDSATPIDLTPVHAALDDLKTSQNAVANRLALTQQSITTSQEGLKYLINYVNGQQQ